MDNKVANNINNYINESIESKTIADDFLSKQIFRQAVQNYYLAVYYASCAFARLNEQTFATQEELLEVTKSLNNKFHLFDPELINLLTELHKLKQNSEFDIEWSISKNNLVKISNRVSEYMREIQLSIDNNTEFVAQTIDIVRNNLFAEAVSDSQQKAFENLIEQLKNEVLCEQPKAIKALNDVLEEPYNEKNMSIFEVRLDDYFEQFPQKIPAIKSLLISESSAALQQSDERGAPEVQKSAGDTVKNSPKTREHAILVPWDFTEVAGFALQHAVNFAKKIKSEIYLINIVKKEKEIADAKIRLEAECLTLSELYGVNLLPKIKAGTIFNQISEFAKEINAKLVIMGTHGVSGVQKFTGSWALKVIAKTEVPFIVVQAPPRREQITDVVFPVDYRREIKQKVNQAKFLSQFYKLKFYISKPAKIQFDSIRQKTINNLYFMRSFFVQNGIEHEVIEAKGTKDYAEATVKTAERMQPDLIIIVLTKEMGFQNFIFGAEEEKIILNTAKVPVMCINPPPAKRWVYSSGTS